MSWSKERIDQVALQSCATDLHAFESIGLSEIADARVLDIGCFDGFNTRLKFAPYGNIAHIVGVDPDAEAIQRAHDTVDDARFSWICTTGEECADVTGPFDLAYFSHSFQHLVDKETALQRVYSLLAPGGWIAIKSIDDSCKVSYPDPDRVMERLFALYEANVLPRTPHTAHTERNNGETLYTRLSHAGFADIHIDVTMTDTCGKTAEERTALFERNTYFRRNVPASVDPTTADEIKELLTEWGRLFERDDYYFASPTFIATAHKPGGVPVATYRQHGARIPGPDTANTPISPLTEDELGEVMAIELDSFPDPWTPVAYAMELRHNPRAHYTAFHDDGHIVGYTGWWETQGLATLARIAVAPQARGMGVGRALLHQALEAAHKDGCSHMQLQVRAQNAGAIAFYHALGFEQMGMSSNYYTNPDDDAVIMAVKLDETDTGQPAQIR